MVLDDVLRLNLLETLPQQLQLSFFILDGQEQKNCSELSARYLAK